MKAIYQGKEVEAIETEITELKENFNSYKLEDGHIIIIKFVITGVQKLVGVTSPDGTPVYQYQMQAAMRVK